MRINRRQFAALMVVLSLPEMSRAANGKSSLFWRAKFPSQDIVLFGYVRVRGDFFPDIMAEGKRLIDQSKLVLIDMNPSLTLSTTKFKNSDLEPVFPRLTQPNQ